MIKGTGESSNANCYFKSIFLEVATLDIHASDRLLPDFGLALVVTGKIIHIYIYIRTLISTRYKTKHNTLVNLYSVMRDNSKQ